MRAVSPARAVPPADRPLLLPRAFLPKVTRPAATGRHCCSFRRRRRACGDNGNTFTEVPDPVVKAGQVLVDVAGVNYYDTYQREGNYQAPLPYVPGLEGAGTVRATGEGVEGIAPGDK